MLLLGPERLRRSSGKRRVVDTRSYGTSKALFHMLNRCTSRARRGGGARWHRCRPGWCSRRPPCRRGSRPHPAPRGSRPLPPRRRAAHRSRATCSPARPRTPAGRFYRAFAAAASVPQPSSLRQPALRQWGWLRSRGSVAAACSCASGERYGDARAWPRRSLPQVWISRGRGTTQQN